MIRRGETIRVGPLRIEVIMSREDRCEVLVCYGNVGLSGMSTWVDMADLERLQQETNQSKTQGD